MKCENCSFYVDREKTEQEVSFARNNSMMMIDTHFCSLGSCDGSMFIDRNRNRKAEKGDKE